MLVSLTVDKPGGLIGMRGRNMAALQLILSLIVRVRLGEWVRVLWTSIIIGMNRK